MSTFSELGLRESFVRTLEHHKITEPTEIQRKTIPLALEGKDVIGCSATGSGKTLAFGAHLIQQLEPGKGIQALILTPTRELAEQVSKSMRMFAYDTKLQVAVVYGGVSIGPQLDQLRRADIVVGTPGRILDHLERGSLKLFGLKKLVLDEADKMLEMGFVEDVVRIVTACPKDRQTLLFSATMSSDIAHLARNYMKNPVEVSVESYVDASKLEQIFYDVPKQQKFSLFVHLLKQEHKGLVMVFCNTRHNTDFVAVNLKRSGIEAEAIHGGLTQAKRNHILKAFHSSKVYVLVCTDVAARGLDIPHVSHVYNYDLPLTSKEYVHRIGRTARAGKEGKAVNLVSERDYENFRKVLRDHSLVINQRDLPQFETVRLIIDDSRGRGRRDDRRGGGGYRRSSGGYRGGDRGGREDRGRGSGRERRSFGGRSDSRRPRTYSRR